jgi:CRP-like cAMP-binding protein
MDVLEVIKRSKKILDHYHIPELTHKEWLILLQFSQLRSIKKGDFFIKAGQTSHQLAFVVKGCFRFFYIKNEVEKTAYFTFENDVLASFECILLNQPSAQSIQALEDSEVFMMDYNQMRKLYEHNHKFEHLGRIIGEHYILMLHTRLSSYLLDTPEERYLRLVNETPDFLHRVPLQHIASFIGVTPVSLSRIRKRILKK